MSRVQEVCEHIVKKFYILQREFSQSLNEWNPQMFATNDHFNQLFGNTLQLVPEFATVQELQMIFREIA